MRYKRYRRLFLYLFFILVWRSLGEEGDTWRRSIESWNTGMSGSEMRICRESRLTGSPHPNPLGLSKNPFFDLPTGEGAPSKIEGVGGVFYWGVKGESFPLVGLGKAQGFPMR